MGVRIAVVVGNHAGELIQLLKACGHDPVEATDSTSALAAAGGGQPPRVVVTNLVAGGRESLIQSLQAGGAWVIGAAEPPHLDRLRAADDLLPLPADEAALAARLALADRVSERRDLQMRMRLSDRLTTVGTLASGVAHEINNPLAVTLANIDFALSELRAAGRDADAETIQSLTEAKAGAERVREIVRDLHVFARAESDKKRALQVEKVAELALAMAGNELKHRARLVKELAAVPPVLANEQQLGQVVLNLLLNAAQAIPVGAASENEVRVRTHVAGEHVVLEVSDTGSGIAPDVLPRIFDPFFTTKDPGEGTGLGLAICHSIVAALGGEIQVESAPTRGSTFRLLLPPAEEGARRPTQGVPRAVASRRGNVLLVDDEPLIGRTLVRVLASSHDVTVAGSAKDAIARIDGGERFDVILCDLMMPEMTGMDLHAELGRRAPDQQSRMIFVTGGAFTPEAQKFLETTTRPWITKPFDADQLKSLIALQLA